MPSIALPFEVESNLLFSADGRHLFARSDARDLWVVDVPEDSRAPLLAPALAERASAGFVIAAGWLDDRVATLTVRNGVLVASHGEWNVAAQASTPLEVALGPENTIATAPARRLDPYLRWWIEINPVEEWPVSRTLVCTDENRLLALRFPNVPWEEKESFAPRLEVVALDVVTALPFQADSLSSVFIGRLPPEPPRPPGLFGFLRRRPDPAPAFRVFELNRRFGWGPGPRRSLERLPRAAFASYGNRWNVSHVALEEAPGEWFVSSEFASAHVSVSAEDRVIGLFTGEGTEPPGPLLVAHAAHESAIVAVNAARARVTVLRLDPHAKAMTCSPLEPRVAYLVDRELYIEPLGEVMERLPG